MKYLHKPFSVNVFVLTDCPVGRMETKFFTADDVPDARQPVRQYGKRGH